MTAATGYSQGIRLFQQGRYDEAVAALAPVAPEPGLIGQLARYYQAQACREAGLQLARDGQLKAAQEYLRRTIKLIGPSADLACYLARIFDQMGRHDRAEAQLDMVAQAYPDNAVMQARLAVAQTRAGRPAAAMITLRDAIRMHPDSAELHIQMGLLLAREDCVVEARESFRRAVECDCLSADAHYYLGLCEAAQGEYIAAVRSLERVASLRSDDVMAAYHLAVVARAAVEQGHDVRLSLRTFAAPPATTHLKHLADFVAIESDFISAFLSLPVSDADEQLFTVLSAVLETALQAHPRYADLHLRLSLVERRLGRISEAVAHAREAVDINPKYVQAWIVLGELQGEAEPAAAVDCFERAIRSGGNYADVHTSLAEGLIRLGRKDQAHSELRQALQINGQYKRAQQALERLAA